MQRCLTHTHTHQHSLDHSPVVLGGPVLGWTCKSGVRWTQLEPSSKPHTDQQSHCGKHDAALMQHKRSGNAFVQGFTSPPLPLGLKRASQPSLVSLPPPPPPPPPGPQAQRDLLSTHSLGLGFVGSGGASFPGEGDSLPGGGGGESGAIWVGLVSSVIGSDCGRGGGGGGGGSGDCGGAVSAGGLFRPVGWSVTDARSASGGPTPPESIPSGGRGADTLGQTSSSLTWNTSAAG